MRIPEHARPPARWRPSQRTTRRAAFRLRSALLAVSMLGGIAALPPDADADADAVAGSVDLGAVAIGSPVASTLYLSPRDPAKLAAFVAALQNPQSPEFHRFLSRPEFVARFAPTDATISSVESALTQLGFTIGTLYANHLALEVFAPAGTMSAAFGVTLRQTARDNRVGITSSTPATLPASMRAVVRGVGGFDTIAAAHGGRRQAAAMVRNGGAHAVAGAQAAGITDQPGFYTPMDYETYYDVLPLVRAGATGRGTTIAIVTLSDFDAADATRFWSAIGVTVGANHLTKIDVDGGTDPATPYSDGDPAESDLDVQQSGAIAPNARVLAYVTPNISSATFLNGFEAAASDNLADVVSCSWGEAELNYLPSPFTGNTDGTFYLQAFHDAFLEMAAQGQTVFTDSDDNGAFEVNRFQAPVFTALDAPPAYTPLYSIHHPSSDPLVTAAGGTTTPFTAHYTGYPVVTVPREQAWSWSYFPVSALQQGESAAAIQTLVEENFAVGGGGGVSIYWPTPDYQTGLAGIAATQPGQALYQLGSSAPVLLATEPAGFQGRNIPDLSANADPDTGYFFVQDGETVDYYGGTSFVAPQFAGTLALMIEKLGHRVGQLNPMLYALQRTAAAPARDIATGDNWGYLAHAGFDQPTGLGVIDAAKLYAGLKSFDAAATR